MKLAAQNLNCLRVLQFTLDGSFERASSIRARAYHCILKLGRTIADLTGSEKIQCAHLAKALQFRPKIMHSAM